jgi:hypothetical protein
MYFAGLDVGCDRNCMMIGERLEFGVRLMGEAGECPKHAAAQTDLEAGDAIGQPSEEDEEGRADDEGEQNQKVSRHVPSLV